MARIGSSRIARAFVNQTRAVCKNTYTDGEAVYLHGHKIVWRQDGDIYFSLCGWPTKTTRDRINHVLAQVNAPFRLCQDKHEAMIYNWSTQQLQEMSIRLPYAVSDFA